MLENNNKNVISKKIFENLDRNSPIPLYYQISKRLEEAIVNNVIPSGSKIENEISLSEKLELSRPTIRRAIQELVDKGLLVRRRGIGTQVVNNKITRGLEFTSMFDDLKNEGLNPQTKVITHEKIVTTKKIAKILSIENNEEILHIKRIRSIKNKQIAILENYLPEKYTNITINELEKTGLYNVMKQNATTFKIAKQKISARKASSEEAKILELKSGDPVLNIERISYDQNGKVVEYGTHCYNSNHYSIETTLVSK